MCSEIAAQHGIHLPTEDIHTEQASGERLYQLRGNERVPARPVILSILDQARKGEISHIITPYQDRLLRGDKADEALIENTLIDAGVTLITLSDKIEFGSDEYNGLLFDLNSLVARQELRTNKRRVKEARKQKTIEGRLSGGYAPYGYRWVPARYDPDTGAIVEAAHYHVIEAEYEIVCEIFRRIRTEGISAIALDFNRRLKTTGSPVTPGNARRVDGSDLWSYSVIHRILHNPHYAGYPSHRQIMSRDGSRRIKLEREKWIMAREEQSYRHPVTMEEQQDIAEIMASRRSAGAMVQGSPNLATGLLRCALGQPMAAGGSASYKCSCAEPHPGRFVQREVTHRLIARVLSELAAEVAGGVTWTAKPSVDRATLRRQYREVKRKRDEQEGLVTRLMEMGAQERAVFGDLYTERCGVQVKLLSDLKAEALRLETELAQPDYKQAQRVIDVLEDVGLEGVWGEATDDERRDLARQVIRAIHLLAPGDGRKHVRTFRVEIHPVFAEFYPSRDFDALEIAPHHSTLRKEAGVKRVTMKCSLEGCGETLTRTISKVMPTGLAYCCASHAAKGREQQKRLARNKPDAPSHAPD